MNRYLLNISYVGTAFRGLQRTRNNVKDVKYLKSTVQGAIELGLENLKPSNEIKLALSSRTDTGVHALHSTVHVDLMRRNGEPYHNEALQITLNRFFKSEELPIRIISAQRVPDTFHCRYNAKCRSYLYRIAVLRDPDLGKQKYLHHTKYIPIEELYRCYFVHNPKFDIDKARDVAKLFKGLHDFRTFMGASQQGTQRDHAFFALRQINNIEIKPTVSLSQNQEKLNAEQFYQYWNIEINGRSFLYRQVRRIVGVILAAARGAISHQNVYEMITIPSTNSWIPSANTAPPYGLYLTKVSYNEEDKQFPPQSEK